MKVSMHEIGQILVATYIKPKNLALIQHSAQYKSTVRAIHEAFQNRNLFLHRQTPVTWQTKVCNRLSQVCSSKT